MANPMEPENCLAVGDFGTDTTDSVTLPPACEGPSGIMVGLSSVIAARAAASLLVIEPARLALAPWQHAVDLDI
jgi:hypothetical protein